MFMPSQRELHTLRLVSLACWSFSAACADVDADGAPPDAELRSNESALVTCGAPTSDDVFYKLTTALPATNGTLIKCEQLPT
jgi:hypothetical protein